ncbi:MAG: hypothetical protein XD94_0039 [Mesotoga prima]|uniref:Uncharacterized protein n=1 Tax=Mesotoga prima TaxID=1184387 RepID=A0A124FYV6_9BACT|nr:MAG: hypothetical protein XD94_0039 [Mesotoga prima]
MTLRFNPSPARMRITISARSLTSAEIDRRVESIVLRRLRPRITPSITRPIKPGRLILSNSDRITIERMIIAETISQKSGSGRLFSKASFIA